MLDPAIDLLCVAFGVLSMYQKLQSTLPLIPDTPRKLLLHKREISKLIGYTTMKGLTVVPLEMYINEDGRAKIQIAVARGKKNYDKRESIAKRDAARDIDRKMKERF